MSLSRKWLEPENSAKTSITAFTSFQSIFRRFANASATFHFSATIPPDPLHRKRNTAQTDQRRRPCSTRRAHLAWQCPRIGKPDPKADHHHPTRRDRSGRSPV